jgi:hypothetical protein
MGDMGRRTRLANHARRSPAGLWRAFRRICTQAAEGAKIGALGGLLMAGLAIAMGLVRIVMVLLAGRSVDAPAGWHEARLLLVYVAAFTIGGALAGVVHGIWTNRLLTTVALMIAGAGVTNFLALADQSSRAYDANSTIIFSLVGCLFGLAAACGLAKRA